MAKGVNGGRTPDTVSKVDFLRKIRMGRIHAAVIQLIETQPRQRSQKIQFLPLTAQRRIDCLGHIRHCILHCRSVANVRLGRFSHLRLHFFNLDRCLEGVFSFDFVRSLDQILHHILDDANDRVLDRRRQIAWFDHFAAASTVVDRSVVEHVLFRRIVRAIIVGIVR